MTAKEEAPEINAEDLLSLNLSRLALMPLPLSGLITWAYLNWSYHPTAPTDDGSQIVGLVLYTRMFVMGIGIGALIGLIITALAGHRRGHGRWLRAAAWSINGTFLAASAFFLFA